MPGCPVNLQVQRKHLFVKFRMLAFTLVFYFIIVFPKWFIGINNCSMWTHVRDKSVFSISHKEDKTMKLNYSSVKAVFDRAKRDVLKSLCYDLKYLWFPSVSFYFPFPFPFPSLPFLFFSLSLCPWATDILCLPSFPSVLGWSWSTENRLQVAWSEDCSFCFDCWERTDNTSIV